MFTRIAAQFTNLTTTTEGEELSAKSIAILHGIDQDDRYTEIRRLTVGDIADGSIDGDDIADELRNIVEEIAAGHGLMVTGFDDGDDGSIFWTLA